VNNLLFALEHLDPQVEVLVFFDSDARVTREWLNALVAPLADAQVGATTGYRWYLPRRGGFRSALLSAWNGAVATTLGDHKRNFAWGGSTAVLRETFDRIGVREGWQGAVSDDYSLTEAVQRAGLAIKFVPCCLVVSREDATLASLLEFTTRQVAITRVYRPRAWWLGLCSHVLFAVALSGGMTLLLAGVLAGDTDMASAILLALIYLLGSIKGVLRLAAAGHALPDVREELARLRLMYWFGWPLVSLVFLYNFVRSAVTRRITWRGVVYEMTSPTDTVVIR
jgi:cellulose synthase/poly-beta-1,6-N-acetylglucosamine synthase-like glycosyltransferase